METQISMKDNTKKIKNKAMEFLHGRTEMFIRVTT